jgi:hypothetical protein
MKAIIVTGSRDWQDVDAIATMLDQERPDVVIHGAARGADYLAGQLAENRGMIEIPMPAQWDTLGKRAGAARNSMMGNVLAAMGECGHTVHVHAFPMPTSRGTWDMVKRVCRQLGLPVTVHGTEG